MTPFRAAIEAEVLRWGAGRAAKKRITKKTVTPTAERGAKKTSRKKTIPTPPQLRDKVLREVTRRNARDRAQEVIRALKVRGVFRQHASGEGLAGLGVVASEPEIAALLA